jgi:cytochrome o ubiquinol oxidase subunit 3
MTADASTIDTVRSEGPEEAGVVATQALGFWLYLMSDLILFSALFATFAVLSRGLAGGPSGKELFHLPRVFVETMLLLASSAACGFTMPAAQGGRRRAVLIGLAVTFLLGAGFLSMEIREFREMVLGGNGPGRSAFLSAFFTLVGAHGAHVFFGMIWMLVMVGQVAVRGLTAPVRSRLSRFSMFWHFLDIVWIGVFTVVYLMGVA